MVSPGGLGDVPDYELERTDVEDALLDPSTADIDETNLDDSDTVRASQSATGPGSPKLFILDYLRSHGGEALARDVIAVGMGKGFTEASLKMARLRSIPPIRTRRRNRAGKVLNYWILEGE